MTTVTQSTFRAALFDPGIARPDGLSDGQARPAGKRFDVYRNNVIVSLKEAMEASFPVIAKLLGGENFARLSDLFVRQNPPDDPCLMFYGGAFPEFLQSFEPLAHLGYLPDVARLELALRSSYHGADAAALSPDVFAQTPPEVLAEARLTLAPAVQLVRSDWPIVDIWHFNMTPDAPKPTAGAQDALVTRAEFDPEIRALPQGGAELIAGFQNGRALGPLLDTIHGSHPAFDFGEMLGLLIGQNALASLETSATSPD